VHELARQFREGHRRLDVLVNNAGGLWLRRERTEAGLERTFAVNHLASFLLTHLPARAP
jgi:retinol dehydrogenase 14